MSYDSVRQDEQMRVLDYSIDAFIDKYNFLTAVLAILGVTPARQTVFLFPGGMASKLRRATTPWNATGPPSQVFNYKLTWGTEVELLGGAARDLKMHKIVATGEYRDKGRRIIIADGVTSIFGVRPYMFFTAWCFFKQIDCFIFPWDWRRSVDEVGTFFVDRFLPHFQERLQNECYVDPLADYSLIGHSAGGLVVNWLLRNIDPLPGNLRKIITVAAPFYGYGGQLHRWFEGEPYANGGGAFTSDIIKSLSSFPGCYAWHFLPKGFYDANEPAFNSDPYPLASYPSVDFTTPTTAADPYDPQPPDKRYPKKPQTGFDMGELARAANLFLELTSPLSPAQVAKFVNIRGDTTANNTLDTTTWKLVPPITPSPITTTTLTPGDGVQPAWTTRDIDLFQQAPGNVITLTGADTAHMIIMDSPQTWVQVAAALGIP